VFDSVSASLVSRFIEAIVDMASFVRGLVFALFLIGFLVDRSDAGLVESAQQGMYDRSVLLYALIRENLDDAIVAVARVVQAKPCFSADIIIDGLRFLASHACS
jgi:hypothetical protein